RNVQGLAFRASDGLAVNTEHGPGIDDEINRLSQGNFGWDPVGPGGAYNEAVPMTDLNKFPSAVPSLWRSGSPTLAPSGATFLHGTKWDGWNGALAVTMLKGQQLLVLAFNGDGRMTGVAVALTDQGRLRSAVLGPDGNLYVTTDNGGTSDTILKVVPG
ncbi:MAG: PQQ-dependent sugar dehydrogenase, partial [Thermoleophilaceae bacterium]|nr:PQQ-dependent sugar dehydrogenase [Thermoleophilaceae bacterium]